MAVFEKGFIMVSNLSKILKRIVTDSYASYKQDSEFEELLCRENLHLEQFPADTMLIHFQSPIYYVCILLDGFCCTEKYNIQGNLLISENIGPVEFFGLFETVHPLPLYQHEASVRCITPCTCLKIPIYQYRNELNSSIEILQISLQALSKFIYRILLTNDSLLLNNARSNILLKLLECSEGKNFPYLLPIKKEELAQTLNITVRTLYRKLDMMYEEGLISSQKGKILITKEQHQKIATTLQNEMQNEVSNHRW